MNFRLPVRPCSLAKQIAPFRTLQAKKCITPTKSRLRRTFAFLNGSSSSHKAFHTATRSGVASQAASEQAPSSMHTTKTQSCCKRSSLSEYQNACTSSSLCRPFQIHYPLQTRSLQRVEQAWEKQKPQELFPATTLTMGYSFSCCSTSPSMRQTTWRAYPSANYI